MLLFSILHVHLSHRRCLYHHRYRPTYYTRRATICHSKVHAALRVNSTTVIDRRLANCEEDADEPRDGKVTQIVDGNGAELEHNSTNCTGSSVSFQ